MLNLKMNNMKKISIISLLLLLSFSTVFGQKKNIVNAALYLKTSQKSKGDDIVKNIKDAKKYIDEAYNNESTSNDPKMWNYRSKIYLQIAIKHSQLDDNAIFKATEAYINCMNKLRVDNKPNQQYNHMLIFQVQHLICLNLFVF